MNTARPIDPKAIRERQGWSQPEMARRLGCDQSTVSRIERGAPISGPIRLLLDQMAALPPAVSLCPHCGASTAGRTACANADCPVLPVLANEAA
jgi:DNA-binding XRE family transcriptional regulator